MGFFDKITGGVKALQDQVKNSVAKFANEDFANASMAMCAMVAAADGDIDPEEMMETADFISTNDTLSVFNGQDLKAKFQYWCNHLMADPVWHKADALAAIAKFKGNHEAAKALVNVGIAIGGSDGDFDADEQKVCAQACKKLGIDPTDLGLPG